MKDPETRKAARLASRRSYYARNRTRLLAVENARRARNPDRTSEIRRDSYLRHKDKRTAESREWYAVNKEAKLRQMRAYQAEHKAELSEKRKLKRAIYSERTKLWYRAHPDVAAENGRIRALRLKRAVVVADRVGLREAYQASKSDRTILCYWCHEPTTQRHRHLDHILPLALGGEHSSANLCIACPKCNSAKGALHPNDFAAQQVFLLTTPAG